ncbi:MAG TPA: cache domain-containing protein [Clostridia bacterium]|nr:cache domain-containing protein [Clostridia bacterium]
MKLTIGKKVTLLALVLLLVPMSIIGSISYFSASDSLNQQGRTILKNSVKSTVDLIEEVQYGVEKGLYTEAEAKERVKEQLLGKMDAEGKRPINYTSNIGENGYIAVYDSEGLEVMHPSLEGQNVWEAKDKSPEEKYLVQDIIRIAENGGGFYEYSWTLPNSEQIGEKITYNEVDPYWGWIISSGTYKIDFNAEANKILRTSLITAIIALIIGIAAVWFIISRITSSLKTVQDSVLEISDGNLSINDISVKTKDESAILAESMNKMKNNLKAFIRIINSESENILESSELLKTATDESLKATNEVSHAMEEIASNTMTQATETQNGTEVIDSITYSIESLIEKNAELNEIINHTKESSEEGIQSIKALNEKSNESLESSKAIRQVVLSVDQQVKEINTIVETITNIAEQTNLLALNASIESARAGEAGRGFAVVANEIRKLAEETSASTGSIQEKINKIQLESSKAVEQVNVSTEVINETKVTVDHTEDKFNTIQISVNNLLTSIDEMNQQFSKVNDEKESIIHIINEIANSSEKTSAATEEVSASSEEQLATMEELSTHADNLSDIVKKLEKSLRKFKL